jgi:hypothetical protein
VKLSEEEIDELYDLLDSLGFHLANGAENKNK